MDEATVREKLRRFITHELMRRPSLILDPRQGIFTSGFVNSLEMARLRTFIESDLGVSIPQREMTVANMDTLDRLVARVLRG